MNETLFCKSQSGQHAYSLPKEWDQLSAYKPDPKLMRKTVLNLPEVSELDLMRHFSRLAQKNMGIDTHFYPLGSCTMKYNPRINEQCAKLPAFTKAHPLAPEETVQGCLELIFELLKRLCQITGMTAGSLLPNAGSQGEYTGIQMIAAYHRERGDLERREILIPDSAHGTNPATVAMAGLTTKSIRSNALGDIDLEALSKEASNKTAGLMLTNPNTLGLFSPKILEIAAVIHRSGGLLYYDGANLNPLLNISRPGEMGFDVMHLNLHKTFSTPHGGGGPGSGPVLCNEKLKAYLPTPQVIKNEDGYKIVWNKEGSIGAIASFHGNFGIYLRAYLYTLLHGNYGLRRIAENAVLNANYLKKKLGTLLNLPYKQNCMHEFVLQADNYLDKGVRALDIAKRLLDYGFHAPTIYFPLIVKECMLIEPTESESKATLDQFVDAMIAIIEEIKIDPELVKTAPHTQSVSRLNEVYAAKKAMEN